MKGSNKRHSQAPGSDGTITDVPGIRVGHAHDKRARTGCTVILCGSEGAVAGVDVRGAAPGTRETDLLEPGNLVERVHAVVLTGGSVFGLDAACGVARYLEERDIGFDAGVARVPIVPAAVIFDLAVGNSKVRPDSAMGYKACQLGSAGPVAEGQVGAGAGATVGKILGQARASRGGVGTAALKLSSGVTVGVLVVVNAFGDIVDPESGRILAGARTLSGVGWLNTSRALEGAAQGISRTSPVENTTLAVVATDASLTKAQARRVAVMAHDGMARAVRPVHTIFDGDTVFALSTGRVVADLTAIGPVAADLVARAIVRVGVLGPEF
ncbi:MAG TPA: P1 family peptidase [Blastocatellia bacterium]|jgi:L-aminopeptidase/D-esterase-like protein|nr:P1 family peptidase [Blastocatellia bacterium]